MNRGTLLHDERSWWGWSVAWVALDRLLIVGGTIAFTYYTLVRRSQEVDRQWAQVQNVYQRPLT